MEVDVVEREDGPCSSSARKRLGIRGEEGFLDLHDVEIAGADQFVEDGGLVLSGFRRAPVKRSRKRWEYVAGIEGVYRTTNGWEVFAGEQFGVGCVGAVPAVTADGDMVRSGDSASEVEHAQLHAAVERIGNHVGEE